MENINKIELAGTVGSARINSVGNRYVGRFSVATNYSYKAQDGSHVIETTWHNVTIWQGKDNPDVSRIEKGSKIQVSGRLRSQKYVDADGVERTSYEVLAYKFELINDPAPLQFQM